MTKVPISEVKTIQKRNSNSYPSSSSHGGLCCGRLHLKDFGNSGPTLERIESLKYRTVPHRCLEITLTTSQANRKGYNGWTWHQVLIELGWKCVMVFRNGNSGANVRVYLFSTSERKLPK